LIDIHVHYGQFRENYYSPDKIITDLKSNGVNKIGLMPTINKLGDNILVSHRTMIKLKHKYKCSILPILWVHPLTSLIENEKMLDELEYKIIKVHGYFHDWHKFPKELNQIILLAKKNKLPIMFHTGGRKESYAFAYKKICKNNPDNIFILAHSRPVKGTINVLKNCPNVYCDSAFTPMNDLKLILKSGFEDHVLFGTDYPIINAFNDSIQQDKLYNEIISKLKSEVGENIFKKITEDNFNTLFA